MKIYALNTGSEDFNSLIKELEGFLTITSYDDQDTLIQDLSSCEGVLVDLDSNKKVAEKFILAVSKSDAPCPVIALCNEMNGKKLKKHQTSKAAADIYLTYPSDLEVMQMLIEEAFNSTSQDNTATVAIKMPNRSVLEDDLADDNALLLHEVSSSEIESTNIDELDLDIEEGLSFETNNGEAEDSDQSGLHELSLSDEESSAVNIEFAEEPGSQKEISALHELNLEGDEEDLGGDLNLSNDLGESLDLEDSLDLEESLDLGVENEELENTPDLEEFDITRPILQDELDQLMEADSGEVSDRDNDEINLDKSLSEFKYDTGASGSEEKTSTSFDINFDSSGSEETSDGEPLDDIATKMREIDEMLKEDGTSLNLETDKTRESGLEFLQKEETKVPDRIENNIEMSYKDHDVPPNVMENHRQFKENHDVELIRLGETIKSLREDRSSLVDKIDNLQGQNDRDEKLFLSIQAELDEKKIEVAVLRKRYSGQIEELNFKLDITADKKEILEKQNKQYESEFDKLRLENKIDVNKVRSKERELEGKLDLLKGDAEVQIRNRDNKILELKRKIDTLEFDIENSFIKERKTVNSQQVLEDKMTSVIKTLRSAIGHLEDEDTLNERENLIKKNLDV